jgi:aminopeptidase N
VLRCVPLPTLLLTLLAVAAPASAQEVPAELVAPGVSLALAEHRAATIGALQYDVDVRVPRQRGEPLAGSVTLRFEWHDPAGLPVVLDFQDPRQRVRSLRVNGEALEPHSVNNHLVIPAGALRHGAGNEVHLEVELGDGPLNRQDDFLYTLFVPDRAHHALPVMDQPDLKARFTLTLDVPDGWRAVANGRLLSDSPAEPDRRRLTFAETDLIPTYLFAFAVGEWERVERQPGGRTMVLYHRETDERRVADNLDAIFELHIAALEWLEEYTGIPYPFDTFEFVAVPSFQYNGMEHPGAVYYRASSLFLEPSATQAQLLGRASLIAHETAHMWFGDLVTMAWFDDVWTKEVFANFFAAKIVNPAFPEIDHDLRFLMAHHPAAYAIDRSRGPNPIRQPLENLAEAGTLYGPIIYQKAPIVMRQLERLIGEEAFQDGIRAYLERFAFGNATWPDLIEILDARTEHDLSEWSQVWVEEPGRPTITVVRDGSGVRLVPSDPAGAGRAWPQTLDPVAGIGAVAAPLAPVDVGAAPVPLDGAPAGPGAWVLPDGRGYGYAHFRLDAASRAALLGAVPGMTDPLHRASALLALWDAALYDDLPPHDLLTLLIDRAAREDEQQILSRALGMLDTAFWMMLCPDERASRAAHIEDVLLTRLAAGGPATLQAALFDALRGIALTPAGVEHLRAIWSGEREVPGLVLGEADRTAAALALALREAPGWRQILDAEAEAIENPERRQRFAFLRPAVDAEPAVREAFFESLRQRGNRAREPWVQAGLGYLNHPLRAEHAARFVRPALEMLEEIQRTGDIFFPQGWIGSVLSGHASPEAVAVVNGFLDEHPDFPPRLREKVLQAVDIPERAAAIRACPAGG